MNEWSVPSGCTHHTCARCSGEFDAHRRTKHAQAETERERKYEHVIFLRNFNHTHLSLPQNYYRFEGDARRDECAETLRKEWHAAAHDNENYFIFYAWKCRYDTFMVACSECWCCDRGISYRLISYVLWRRHIHMHIVALSSPLSRSCHGMLVSTSTTRCTRQNTWSPIPACKLFGWHCSVGSVHRLRNIANER